MKRNNKKLLTIMLAGMLCTATIGTAAAIAPVNASAADAQTYALTDIFKSNDKDAIKGADGKTSFTLGNGDNVQYTRNLAIKWFADATAQYTTVDFTFGDINFKSMSFTFKSLPMHATKDDVVTNTVKFINTDGAVSVKVIPSGVEEKDVEAVATTIAKDSVVTLSLNDNGVSDVGEYFVNLSVGGVAQDMKGAKFTNIGAKYFGSGSEKSFEISTDAEGDKTSVVYLNAINGQSFANLNTDGKVVDNATPVLVVNQEVGEMVLGIGFQLDYKFLDVLEAESNIKTTDASSYYQYSLADKAAPADDDYTTLQIKEKGTYFMETAVYKNAAGEWVAEKPEGEYTATTVYRTEGAEYVSIKFSPKDKTFTGEDGAEPAAVYELSWYANTSKTIDYTDAQSNVVSVEYLVFKRDEVGPNYKTYDPETVEGYTAELQERASKVSGGSNAEIELPSLAWLIEDANNGYDSLKFTISYKSHSSSSPQTTPTLKANALKLDAEEPGQYEFKVFATDATGNPMKVVDKDGDLVEVTSSNIWDLENIPSFTYTIKAQGLKVDEDKESNRLESKTIGSTASMSDVTIVGVTGAKVSEYKLYKLDFSKYTDASALTTDKLKSITFEALQKEAQKVFNAKLADGVAVNDVDFAEVNKTAYANLVADKINGDATKLLDIFVEIEKFDSRITEDTEDWDNSDNKFNWNPDSRNFTAAEDGIYMILADYWDTDMQYVDHVPAYKLVEVESAKDIIKGETEWLKNNIVSVILFSVAGLMLILIIILLLVKPSDETLEDVDEKVVSKRKEATDKNKKK